MISVSVIVPIYNVERFLPQCIDSILQQTFSDFELILVDDGSPDCCGQICDEYAQKDTRIHVIHKENEGVSAARNTALKIASGQYITFCDSDDYYQPDWLENLVSAVENHQADLALGNFLVVSETGEILNTRKQEIGVFALEQPQERVHYCINKIFGARHGWEACTRLFRAEIIQKNNIRFCETCGNFAEDLGFTLEYTLHVKRIVCVDAAGYCYRVRQGSMMQTSKGVVRLDSMNEVGIYFLERAKQVLPCEYHDTLPLFFFLIMYNQYGKIIGTERFCLMQEEIKKIRRYDQWKRNTKAIFRVKKQMRRYLGKISASRILLLCRYCLHGNWNLFKLDSAIFYRIHKI